uniref:Uncharacterized protein n=1 Tax=Caenorhabditis japonica TaxID=281687 RepID=A0A8R1E0L4_CAEJA
MGRENKTKLLRKASLHPSPAPTPIVIPAPAATPDESYFFKVAYSLDSEEMKANLREMLKCGPSDVNQKLSFLFSELEKKEAEVHVAKKIVEQFQREEQCGDVSIKDEETELIPKSNLQEGILKNKEKVFRLKSIGDELDQVSARTEDAIKQREDLEQKLENAIQTSAALKEENTDLTRKLADQLQSALEQEKNLKEKFETRFESINSGVQLIKKDFNFVKTDLVKMHERNKELDLQLTASKADAKYYRGDGDHCRKYIKKLEDQIAALVKASETRKNLEEDLRKHEKTVEEFTKNWNQATADCESLRLENSQFRDEIEVQKSNYQKVTSTLESERINHETKLRELEKMLEATSLKFDQSIADCSAAQEQIVRLQADVDSFQVTIVEREKVLQEKYSLRFESINNGVQLIKKDLAIVKTDLLTTRKINEELVAQLADKTSLEIELESVREELESKEADSVLSDVRKFKEDFGIMKNRAIDLSEQLEKLNSESSMKYEEELKLRKKLEEELESAKRLLKKVRKEKDNSSKKVKKSDDEIRQLQANISKLTLTNKSLSEDLSKAMTSQDNLFELEKKILQLEEEKRSLEVESAEDRKGLVNELIVTQDKLEDYNNLSAENGALRERTHQLELKLKEANEENTLSVIKQIGVPVTDKLLSSIGHIVDAVNEGMEVLSNTDTIRTYLGSSGRFRLVSDNGLIEQMPIWFDQYHREMAAYNGAYRGSEMPNPYVTPMTMKAPPMAGKRSFGMNIKTELDSITMKTAVPIRFNGGQLQDIVVPQDYDESVRTIYFFSF